MSNDSRPNLPPFPSSYRASGLLLHVTSLPSPYGIGDVGPAAIAWIDQLYEAGQSWWQALPLGPTGYSNSPYQALSSFAGNGLLISPDWLIEDGLKAGDRLITEGLQFVKPGVEVKASEATNVSSKNPTPAQASNKAAGGKWE